MLRNNPLNMATIIKPTEAGINLATTTKNTNNL